MKQVKRAVLAVCGSLGLASLVIVPGAFATSAGNPLARPTPTKTVTSSVTTKQTKTKVKVTTTEPPCKPQAGIDLNRAKTLKPWAQNRLNFTEVWKLTQGRGVKVAVVDSGVDGTHPQLEGALTDSADVTRSRYKNRDCLGHGTSVAGIIAARDKRHESGIPFMGVAPQSQIVSSKFTNEDSDKAGHLRLPLAIRRAADLGAQVINVSATQQHTDALQASVKYAQSHDVVIVASSGNVEKDDRTQTAAFPANYPGVISVGSTDENGQIQDTSNKVTKVSATAPGKSILTTWPVNTYNPGFQGTSAAAPFVAGTAALVRAYHPRLSYDQVRKRIEKTADGGSAQGTGKGMVNPLQAVTAVIPGEKASSTVSRAFSPRSVTVTKPDPDDRFSRVLGLTLAIGALGIAGAVAAGGVIIPAGRRRGWKVGSADPPSDSSGPQ